MCLSAFVTRIYGTHQIRTRHLDENVTDADPKKISNKEYTGIMSQYGSNQYSSRGELWDRDIKNQEKFLEEKRIKWIYLSFCIPIT